MNSMTKARFYDILLTALIGASIAFLQSLLAGLSVHQVPAASPELAALSAGTLRLVVGRLYF